jgi:hypothetical protein
MNFVFNRTYVAANNVGYIKGTPVPSEFPSELVQILMENNIVKAVESPAVFLAKTSKKVKTEVAESEEVLDEVEALNPDRKARSK